VRRAQFGRRPDHRSWVIAVGVLFLLRNVGIVYFDDLWQFWPVILIVLGLSKLSNPHSASNVVSALIISGIGTVFLLRNLGYIYGDVWSTLARHPDCRRPLDPGEASGQEERTSILAGQHPGPDWFPIRVGRISTSNFLHTENVFSGTRQKVESQDFEGGKIADGVRRGRNRSS
jgi:hypothetical protein